MWLGKPPSLEHNSLRKDQTILRPSIAARLHQQNCNRLRDEEQVTSKFQVQFSKDHCWKTSMLN